MLTDFLTANVIKYLLLLLLLLYERLNVRRYRCQAPMNQRHIISVKRTTERITDEAR